MSYEDKKAGAVRGLPLVVLRAEGLVVLAAATVAYHVAGANWWMFALLFLVPDVGMLGHLKNPKLGSMTYNALHTYIVPAPLLGWSLWSDNSAVQAVALIWIAHIGFDRMVGYGLKYATSFNATHLG